MKKSSGGIIFLIAFVIYTIKENWIIIVIIITIVVLLYVFSLWINKKKASKFDTSITDNTPINDTIINNITPVTDNNTINDNTQKFKDNIINETSTYAVLTLNDTHSDKLSSFIKYSIDYSKNLHTINSIRRIQNYQEKYTRSKSAIGGTLFGFIINCSNETLKSVKESNHKNRIIAECKTVILIITELKKGSTNEHIVNLLRTDDSQSERLNSFTEHVFKYFDNYLIIKSVTRIQRFNEEYSKQYWNESQLFDFILDSANDTLKTIKESTHKNRILAECKAVILITTELKKGSTNEHIVNLLRTDDSQSERLNYFTEHAFKSANNYLIINSVTRIQRFNEEYNKQYWNESQLFDFILDSANDTLKTIKESTHKNRIIAECKAVILITTELKKGSTNEHIVNLLRTDDSQSERLDSFIKHTFKSPSNYSIVKSISRIQLYREEYYKQNCQELKLFDFILNSANETLITLRKQSRKKRIIAECKTIILLIEELKKGSTNGEIISLLNIKDEQYNRISDFINSAQSSSINYLIIRPTIRIQKYIGEYYRQNWHEVNLFDFIIKSVNETLFNIGKSTHKNNIIEECKTCILIIEELKNDRNNKEIISLLINNRQNAKTDPLNQIKKSSIDKTILSKKTLNENKSIVYNSKDELTKGTLSVSDIITMLLSSKLKSIHIQNETIGPSINNKDSIILDKINNNKEHKLIQNINILDVVLGVLIHNEDKQFSSNNKIQVRNTIRKVKSNTSSIVTQPNRKSDSDSNKNGSFDSDVQSNNYTSVINIKEISKPQNTNILNLIEGVIKYITNRDNSEIAEAKEENNLSFEDDNSIIDITDTPAYKISIENPEITYNINNNEKTSTKKEYIKISDYSKHPFLFRGRNKEFLYIKSSHEAPHWGHSYIYDVSTLKHSNNIIKQFYNEFKKSFFEGMYYDSHLSSNYYFTLLFDLLNEYESHNDIIRLEQQLYTLNNYYPKVMKYAIDNLLNIIDNNKDTTININTLIEYYPNYHWRLGYKYANKLGLSVDEQQLFNKLLYTPNKFSSIENIQYEIIELFLHTLREYGVENFNNKVISVANNIIGEYFPRHFTSGSETIEIEIWYCIYKQCENTVRSLYSINEKQNIYSSYYTQKSESIINDEIIIPLKNIISLVKNEQQVINRNTEIKLNKNFPTRWRRAYDQLVQESVDKDIEFFINGLVIIHDINTSNVNIKNMYYEAMKITYKTEPTLSLKLYIEYITINMSDIGGKEKTIPKYISKELFKIKSQEESFDNIIRIYKEGSDKIKANDAIDKLYTQERRKIKLNTYEINKIAKLHSKTVKLLNDVLDDELENIEHKQMNEETATDTKENMNINIIHSVLNDQEQKLLYIFRKENYTLNKTEVESYCKSLNLMPNRLIEKINDTFYDMIDDVLIEDDGDNWAISEDYFKIISKNETKYKN